MGTFMQVLPAGFETERYRSTDSTVFSVVEGAGQIIFEDHSFDFSPRDTFVVPSWMPYTLKALRDDVVLFSFSDRPIQNMLGLWREQRGQDVG